ncbi:DUF3558 domain-containing protein [Streptomyces sp. BPTC-684]|uniref:DUF3558 domain-containing protein n=1 Tax=Streptomyces sp. BPTC-684 TaxID=3043734 RepID=UPI0024B11548|nr:DUF3558 domain-containing protein [Streptomyces sp. BPTC-684]WHM37307.1 DUF3558 domain-containing protein [Streptomyces sp. BPTC-684]
MQRKAYVPGVALLVVLVAGCSSGSGTDGTDTDSKAGVPKAAAAPPGRYRTLPEPCRAVNKGVLKDMLPGAADLPDDQKAKAYAGAAELTYDTDRRVGCRWKDEAPDGVHRLYVDFERVVSYDPAVSDDDRAKAVYGKKESAAKLPAPKDGGKDTPRPGGAGKSATPHGSPSGTPSGKPSGTPSTGLRVQSQAASPAAPTTPPASSGPPATTPDGLQPRILTGLGDAAYLDDALTASGSAAQRRTVTVVFRTSNVIVTVEYTEQPGSPDAAAPDSQELQEKTQALAAKLAELFGD